MPAFVVTVINEKNKEASISHREFELFTFFKFV